MQRIYGKPYRARVGTFWSGYREERRDIIGHNILAKGWNLGPGFGNQDGGGLHGADVPHHGFVIVLSETFQDKISGRNLYPGLTFLGAREPQAGTNAFTYEWWTNDGIENTGRLVLNFIEAK